MCLKQNIHFHDVLSYCQTLSLIPLVLDIRYKVSFAQFKHTHTVLYFVKHTHKSMHEVNQHHKRKYFCLPLVNMTLTRCFHPFSYYRCHIQPTNISVYLLQSAEVCVCVCVCARARVCVFMVY